MVCNAAAAEAASPIVRAIVGNKLPLFVHFPDLTRDDLYQTAMQGVIIALPRFRARKATFSTFVGTIAVRRLIDVWRHRSRQAGREAHYAEANWGFSVSHNWGGHEHSSTEPFTEESPLDVLTADEPDPDPNLADWLGTLYSLAKRALEGKHRQGRRFFNVAQVLCVGLLMEREGLSVIDCRELFERRDDLAKACRFMHVPSLSWFRDAAELSATFLARPGVRDALASFTPTLSRTV